MIHSTLFYILLILALLFNEKIYRQNQPIQFELLKPAQTNVYFSNELRDTPEANIMLYSNYYGGAGVGIGNINNDGLQDIFFAGNRVADRLYLNKGNMVFEDMTKKANIIDNGDGRQVFYLHDILNLIIREEISVNIPMKIMDAFILIRSAMMPVSIAPIA